MMMICTPTLAGHITLKPQNFNCLHMKTLCLNQLGSKNLTELICKTTNEFVTISVCLIHTHLCMFVYCMVLFPTGGVAVLQNDAFSPAVRPLLSNP